MNLLLTFAGSFLVQYILMSLVTIYKIDSFTHTLSKLYLSLLVGFVMVMYELLMRPWNSTNQRLLLWNSLGFAICVIMYRFQFGVNDSNFLREMIEHHSMALFTTDNVLRHTKRSDVAALAWRINADHSAEIEQMKAVLTNIANNM
jgi:hypothetical protein